MRENPEISSIVGAACPPTNQKVSFGLTTEAPMIGNRLSRHAWVAATIFVTPYVAHAQSGGCFKVEITAQGTHPTPFVDFTVAPYTYIYANHGTIQIEGHVIPKTNPMGLAGGNASCWWRTALTWVPPVTDPSAQPQPDTGTVTGLSNIKYELYGNAAGGRSYDWAGAYCSGKSKLTAGPAAPDLPHEVPFYAQVLAKTDDPGYSAIDSKNGEFAPRHGPTPFPVNYTTGLIATTTLDVWAGAVVTWVDNISARVRIDGHCVASAHQGYNPYYPKCPGTP
jgi:hypothetical protein